MALPKRDIIMKFELPLIKIIEYFGNSKRPIKEGEEIVKAGWIQNIGIDQNLKDVIGRVVQTSNLSTQPHEVKLQNLLAVTGLWRCRFSCKAGEGAKCKHIAACLLYINRYPDLKGISCTEIRQKWGKIGPSISKKYQGIEAGDMCHVRKKIKITDVVTEAQHREIFSLFEEAQSCSEVIRLCKDQQTSFPLAGNQVNSDQYEFLKGIIDHDGLKGYAQTMNQYLLNSTIIADFSKIKKNVDESIKICTETVNQTSAQWLVERRLRITGSVSYSLYTYASNPNWPKKLNGIYSGTFKGNENTKYGIYAEKIAKQVYGNNYLLMECGLIISPDVPFLAVSPDGISFNGEELFLVEIKSPVKGKEMTAAKIIHIMDRFSWV